MITNRKSIMLHHYCGQFFEYCQLADFSARSIQALNSRLNELTIFLKTRRIRSVKRVRYRHLIDYAADYSEASIHVTKYRVWALRQFYHFLTLDRIVSENIATGIRCNF
jgi:integrase/recombinase XerC